MRKQRLVGEWALRVSVPILAILTVILNSVALAIVVAVTSVAWLIAWEKKWCTSDKDIFWFTSIYPGFWMGLGITILTMAPTLPLGLIGAPMLLVGAHFFSLWPRVWVREFLTYNLAFAKMKAEEATAKMALR